MFSIHFNLIMGMNVGIEWFEDDEMVGKGIILDLLIVRIIFSKL